MTESVDWCHKKWKLAEQGDLAVKSIVKTGVLKFVDQCHRRDPNAIVTKDNEFCFNMALPFMDGAYPDDMMTITRDLYESFENPDEDTLLIKMLLQFAIEVADKRAFRKHKFSKSPEEAKFKPNYMDSSDLIAAIKKYESK